MNPLLGIILHAIGGFSSASVYVPIYKVKGWAWITFWITLGFTAWIVMPEVGAWGLWLWGGVSNWHNTGTWATAATPWDVIKACPLNNLFWTYFFGVLWGIGGLTCGLGLRYLGMSLGQSLELGFCTAFGTIMPPLFAHEAKMLFTTSSSA